MCTVASYRTKDFYFGRNLDLEFSYHETVTITPRNKPFFFRQEGALKQHYALIGMSYNVGDYPLYYDASNEKGLSIAGLNFPGNAKYQPIQKGRINIASFELIPYLLGRCASVSEVRDILEEINVTDESFSEQLPASPLHWMIADRNEAIVFEQTELGARVFDNPVGVMTNNPGFEYQMLHLQDYLGASASLPENRMARGLHFDNYSRGMGGFGIPGDLSSASRFVKAAFTKLNSVSGEGEEESVMQFFRILGSVEQQKGCCHLGRNAEGEEQYEYTIYSSCCNTDRGIYYYTTYENSAVCAVDMHKEDLEGSQIVVYELNKKLEFIQQN